MKALDTLILIALLKQTSAHSALLIGQYQYRQKLDFNNCINHIDTLIASLEKNLTAEEIECLNGVSDCLGEIVMDVKGQVVLV
jgi:hypothetical protein